MKVSSQYIIDAVPKIKDIDLNLVYKIENKLLSDHIKDGITEEEIKTILDFVISEARKLLEEIFYIDISDNPLTNKCDLVQAMIGHVLEKLGAYVRIASTQEVIDKSVEGHSFLIVSFPLKKDNEVIEKFYIIDPTYRQFFLKENCRDTKYFIKDNHILIAPHPGYYYLHNQDMIPIAIRIIEDGYIVLDDITAKAYGDSFYVTHRGYSNSFDQNKKTNISGSIYINSFLKAKSQYSKSEEELRKYMVYIPTPSEILYKNVVISK